MRNTGKIFATAALVGAAAGIYTFQQMNKTSSKDNGAVTTSDEREPFLNVTTTKTSAGKTQTPMYDTSINHPLSQVSLDRHDSTSSNMKIDVQ